MAMEADRQRNKELIASMSLKEKIVYYVQNYWGIALVGGIVLAILLIAIGRVTWNKEAPRVVGIGLHAVGIDTDLADGLTEHFTETYPELITEKREYYTYWYYNGYAASQTEQQYTTKMQLVGGIAAGRLDILIGDAETLEEDCALQYTCALSDLFTEEELAAIEAAAPVPEGEESGIKLVSFDITGDTGRTVERVRDEAYLICITGCDAALDETLLDGEIYLALVDGSDRRVETRNMVFTLLGLTDLVSEQDPLAPAE